MADLDPETKSEEIVDEGGVISVSGRGDLYRPPETGMPREIVHPTAGATEGHSTPQSHPQRPHNTQGNVQSHSDSHPLQNAGVLVFDPDLGGSHQVLQEASLSTPSALVQSTTMMKVFAKEVSAKRVMRSEGVCSFTEPPGLTQELVSTPPTLAQNVSEPPKQTHELVPDHPHYQPSYEPVGLALLSGNPTRL